MQIFWQFVGPTVLLLASWGSAGARIPERALDQKVAAYQRKITEAMTRLGASYKISLRPVDNAETDVFTEVVRNEEMRNQSFIINVTADFLEKQPDILFEASSLHEICHVMNDDLTGYHRNGANIEAAEEHCVLQATGEARYREYLQAYAKYQHWDNSTYETVLQKVKDVVLVPAPTQRDEADEAASKYFRSHRDGKEHLLVYNGELHEVSSYSRRNRALHDPDKLKTVMKAGKPMVFFHNHPADGGRAAMFPNSDDFAAAGLLTFVAYRENPKFSIEFRVLYPGQEDTIVSYGFKGRAIEELKKLASDYRTALAGHADITQIEARQNLFNSQLAQDSFRDYLQYACSIDDARRDGAICRTHPQYFLWPSDRFFIRYRQQ